MSDLRSQAACRICNRATACTVPVTRNAIAPCPAVRYVCKSCQCNISQPAADQARECTLALAAAEKRIERALEWAKHRERFDENNRRDLFRSELRGLRAALTGSEPSDKGRLS